MVPKNFSETLLLIAIFLHLKLGNVLGISPGTGYQFCPAWTCEPLHSQSFNKAYMFPRAREVIFYFSSIFFKHFFWVVSYLNVLTFKVTIFMMGQSQSSRKESSITFPPMKTGTTYVNQEKEEFFPDSSSSNAEPGYLKK